MSAPPVEYLRGETPGVAASGSRRSRVRAWRDRFLGATIEQNALVEVARPLTLREAFERFWPDARPFRWWIVVGTLLSAAGSGIAVVEISLFQYVVDDVLAAGDLGPLRWLAAVYVGLALVAGLLSGVSSYLSTWLSQSFKVAIRTRVFAHVLSLPQEVHDRSRLGDCLSRLTVDTASIDSLMISTVRSTFSTVMSIGFYLIALTRLDGWLTLASLLVIPVFWFVSYKFSRLIKTNAREQRRRGGSMSAIAQEQLGHAALVQTFGREKEAIGTFAAQSQGVKDSALAATRIRGVFSPLVNIAELAGVLTIIALGTHAVSSGRLTLGGLMAFLTLLVQLYRPMRTLATLAPSVYGDLAGCERVAELLDEQPPAEVENAPDLPAGRAGVQFDRVSLTYPGASRPAITDLSLSVAPGELVALGGPSGAGKSTLLRLLMRAFDASAGAVRVGGHDVRSVSLRSLRMAIALVPQETSLLDCSVLENIGFARADATDVQIIAAARAAAADDFITTLPQGYHTRLGAEGRTLSGGQRQRLALARAFLRDSPIFLLDEPTTGLDAATARQVLEPLRLACAEGRTVIVASHDPAVLEIADRVVLIDGGLVVSDERFPRPRLEAVR